MAGTGPIKRKDLIALLRKAGFEGPYSGGKHQFIIKGSLRLTLHNPHQSDIGTNLLSKILKQAGLAKEEWENL